MLVAFLIMLREGIEAALIVGIVAGFLKQSGHSKLMPKVWFGVVLASLMCLGLGYGIHSATGEIPQKQQEFVVGIIGLVAVAMLTYMVLWMKKAARSMKQQLQDSVQAALNRGSGQGWALVGMAFLAVAREGLESVFFLLAVFKQSPTWQMPAGAVAGVLAAAVIGALIYQGGMRLNLAKFFRWTGAFLIVVAAGLLAGSLRALHEAAHLERASGHCVRLIKIFARRQSVRCAARRIFRLYRPSDAGRGLGLAAVPYSRHDLVFVRQQAV